MNDKGNLTVIMYHYIRDLKRTIYPKLKGLELKDFKEQLSYLSKNYNFIDVDQIIDSFENGTKLPSKSVLLTFDDGYLDHFVNVLPILEYYKIKGAFYPPVSAIVSGKLMDVNKIHLILASTNDTNVLIKETKRIFDNLKEKYELESWDYYYNKLAIESRYDSKDIIFFKRLLQSEIKVSVRKEIINLLFRLFVNVDENILSNDLYMNIDHLKYMNNQGMHIGCHGFNHNWLGKLSPEEQENEIISSLHLINEIGGDLNKWTISYPYGSYNDDTIKILNKYNCKLGFSTEVNVLKKINNDITKYMIPRLDTNDFPKNSEANVNKWYNIVL